MPTMSNQLGEKRQQSYTEVSSFQMSDGLAHNMEPVKTSRIFLAAVAGELTAVMASSTYERLKLNPF